MIYLFKDYRELSVGTQERGLMRDKGGKGPKGVEQGNEQKTFHWWEQLIRIMIQVRRARAQGAFCGISVIYRCRIGPGVFGCFFFQTGTGSVFKKQGAERRGLCLLISFGSGFVALWPCHDSAAGAVNSLLLKSAQKRIKTFVPGRFSALSGLGVPAWPLGLLIWEFFFNGAGFGKSGWGLWFSGVF